MSNSLELSGNVKFVIPNVANMNQIKKSVVQTADCIITDLEYPNGLKLHFEQRAGNIDVTTNGKPVKNPDGTYSFEL